MFSHCCNSRAGHIILQCDVFFIIIKPHFLDADLYLYNTYSTHHDYLEWKCKFCLSIFKKEHSQLLLRMSGDKFSSRILMSETNVSIQKSLSGLLQSKAYSHQTQCDLYCDKVILSLQHYLSHSSLIGQFHSCRMTITKIDTNPIFCAPLKCRPVASQLV